MQKNARKKKNINKKSSLLTWSAHLHVFFYALDAFFPAKTVKKKNTHMHMLLPRVREEPRAKTKIGTLGSSSSIYVCIYIYIHTYKHTCSRHHSTTVHELRKRACNGVMLEFAGGRSICVMWGLVFQ